MIENASSMDRPVATPGRLTRPRLIALVVPAVAVILAAIAFPSIRRWSRADRAIDATTLGVGTVSRGDLRRDVSVQGRVVAALHPTLIAQAAGSVTLQTKAGAVVKKGEILAVIDSPELRSALEQAKAQLLTMQSDVERQKIVSRQADARLRQQADLARTRLEAARRALKRAETLHREGLLNGGDYEKARTTSTSRRASWQRPRERSRSAISRATSTSAPASCRRGGSSRRPRSCRSDPRV